MFNIGVIGCGQISGQYLTNLTTRFQGYLSVAACADIDFETAKAVADEFGVNKACSPDTLLSDDSIQAVLNLTNPWAHTEVNRAILNAGKHVYAEKPLALNRDEAAEILSLAASKKLRVSCAPDTFLGAGLQTCIKLIDEGWIGRPTAAYGSISMPGHRLTARYQSAGIGGVLLDMGPYYVTALVSLFGPVKRLAGFAGAAGKTKAVTGLEKSDYGQRFAVETPSTVSGTLEFEGPVFAHLTTTVESHTYGPRLEVIGTQGVLVCNDPNMFGGPVILSRKGSEPREMPLVHRYDDRNRGIGMVEMLLALEAGRPHRANSELAYHVLDVMLGLGESSASGRYYVPEERCSRPEPLPLDFDYPF